MTYKTLFSPADNSVLPMAIFFVPKPVRRSWFLRSLWRSRIAKADVFMAKTPRNLRNPWLYPSCLDYLSRKAKF